MKNIKVFDMFSGFGGFHQACAKLSMEIVAFCEINKFAKQFYTQAFNTKNMRYFDDATKIDTRELPDFDLLCARFPCQAFSIAGKRQGFNDTRGTLFFEVARILKDKRPRYFLLENVKGLLNHDNGQTFITIIKTLTDIGYNIEWALLNSKYFGVPQNRERIFIVGYLGKRSFGKIFPLSITNQSNNNTAKEVIYWKNSKEKWVKEFRNCVGAIKTQGDLCRQPLIKVGTLRTHNDGKGFREIKCGYCPTIPARAREDGSGQPVILQLARGKNQGGIHEECTTITKNQWEYNNFLSVRPILTPNRLNKRQNGRRIKNENEEMFTITAQDRHGILYDSHIRRLTPLECFRLQGFSDEVFYKGSQGISDAQLYKGQEIVLR